jgi:hypothetical protein
MARAYLVPDRSHIPQIKIDPLDISQIAATLTAQSPDQRSENR